MRPNRIIPCSLVIAAIGLAGTAIAARPSGSLVEESLALEAARETATARSTPSAPATSAAAIPRSAPAPIAYAAARAATLASTDVPDRARQEKAARGMGLPLLANDQVLAFYGHPLSRNMGILGEYPKEQLAALLKAYSRLYDEANGREGILPAFYIIYGTCWPEGEIGYLSDSILRAYIEYAAKEGILVFVDHQIGKYSVAQAVRRLLPWLHYPNVHLALDPEWRTLYPMAEIGSVDASEINEAQALIDEYMKAEGIEGRKILVVHQFTGKMISSRDRVRADYERVILIHTADGFGSPGLKRCSYTANASATNMPLKGFKLFFKTDVQGAGYDEPLLTPPEVLALDPRPELVIYQ